MRAFCFVVFGGIFLRTRFLSAVDHPSSQDSRHLCWWFRLPLPYLFLSYQFPNDYLPFFRFFFSFSSRGNSRWIIPNAQYAQRGICPWETARLIVPFRLPDDSLFSCRYVFTCLSSFSSSSFSSFTCKTHAIRIRKKAINHWFFDLNTSIFRGQTNDDTEKNPKLSN